MEKKLNLDTPEKRAARVIAANGRAPNLIKSMTEAEIAELAAMITPDGKLQPGTVTEGQGETAREIEVSPQERFRLFMVEYAERRKATDEVDDPSDVLPLDEESE